MFVIQYEVFIISEFYKLVVHTKNTKDLLSRLKSTQQDRVSNNQSNMIGNGKQKNISGGIVLFYALVLDTSN